MSIALAQSLFEHIEVKSSNMQSAEDTDNPYKALSMFE